MVTGKVSGGQQRPVLAELRHLGSSGCKRPSGDIAVSRKQTFGIVRADLEHARGFSREGIRFRTRMETPLHPGQARDEWAAAKAP